MLACLERQGTVRLGASGEALIDLAIAAGFDVVDATTDIVVAAELDDLSGVGSRVMDALDFVLEGSGTLGPGTSEFAFDVTVGLKAASGTDVALAAVNRAFVDDVVIEVTVTIVQAFAIADATGSLDGEFRAADAGAVEPEFAGFDGIAFIESLTLFEATSLDQSASSIFIFLADVDAIFLVRLLFLRDTFATFDASLADGGQSGFGAGGVGLANVETAAVFESFASLVLLTVPDASGGFEGQGVVTTSQTGASVVFVVVVTSNRDAG